ncbi:hypothetical protein SASPL_141588 [Salvia splendens]|uniref:DUF7910 domain-containing protein n=1 Tax=Salvia splendens TaxID=180675 RepID=A0A8X8WTD9_SALSN|nr:hypothetical protein SASPL_141588 [Salvia splendens]
MFLLTMVAEGLSRLTETFLLLGRHFGVSESIFQFCTSGGQFLTYGGDGDNVTAAAELPSDTETFYLERNNNQIHIKLKTGMHLQVCSASFVAGDRDINEPSAACNADPLELYQANIGDTNTVIDLHYYNLFDAFFANMSSIDNIQYIYKSRGTQLQSLNGANGPLIIDMYKNAGEWVNEWNVNGSQTDYQDFGRAQLEVYNVASFGWAYWTLKNDMKHWDFEWNVRNNYLQLQLGCSSCRRSWSYAMFLGSAFGFFFVYGV